MAVRVANIARALSGGVAIAAFVRCAPCAGTESCSTPPRVVFSGTILDLASGQPVTGARIDATISGSQPYAPMSALTDDIGVWQMSQDIHPGDRPTATFTVTAPGEPSYTTQSMPARIITTNGDAQILTPWASAPYARFIGSLSTHSGRPLVGAGVHFSIDTTIAATSGRAPYAATPRLKAMAPRIVRQDSITNIDGGFEIDMAALSPGVVTGMLVIRDSTLPTPVTIRPYVIPIVYEYTIRGPSRFDTLVVTPVSADAVRRVGP